MSDEKIIAIIARAIDPVVPATDRAELAMRRLRDAGYEVVEKWRCGARGGSVGGNDPQDCGWPECGCDPDAGRVIDALYEQDLTIVPRIPDSRMIRAGARELAVTLKPVQSAEDTARDIYRAMLSAPSPTQEGGEG